MVKNNLVSGQESPHEFAKRLQLKIRNYSLLSRALTHRSFINENPEEIEDNERLEFLGDAILDFVVGDWLYNRYPEMLEGELTQMRSALVQTPQLADFATQINLGNVNHQTLEEIWLGELMTVRDRHMRLDFNFSPCNKCEDWQGGRAKWVECGETNV